MGMSYNVYVGPFLRVPTFRKDVPVPSYQCTGCGNKKVDKSTPFCPKCGNPVQNTPVTQSQLVIPRPYDLADEFNEKMFIAESGYSMAKHVGYVDWMPNRRGFGTTLHSYEDSEALILSQTDRDAALAHFVANHQSLVDAAEALFGVKVQVLYGAVPYSH